MSGYRPIPLDHSHDLSGFDCGIQVLNDWLTYLAPRAQRQDTARTYVWTVDDPKCVVGYFSIAPTEIHRSESELPRSLSAGVTVCPAYLVARLALDRSLHGRGLGGVLLSAALEVVVSASSAAGGRLVVVDPIDKEAAAFYRLHEFRAAGDRRLVMRVGRRAGPWEGDLNLWTCETVRHGHLGEAAG